MPEFFGLCSRHSPKPCKLGWSQSVHPRVGTFPSDFLPSQNTIYFISTDAGYNFSPPVISPGESFGSPIFGLLNLGELSIQFDSFSPVSRIVLFFARTSNRLNSAHILTQAEINSINPITGIGEINVGEYIFDAIAVTDQIEVINTQLTADEQQQITNGTQTESDIAFRKLFQQDIPDARSRLDGVKPNIVGIEYRLDNGDSKAVSALDDSGSGFFVGENSAHDYRDGSSKILRVNLIKITERLPLPPGNSQPDPGSLQAQARIPRAGDVIYLTYVAIREHYFRQSVQVSWSVNAISLPPQCFSYPTKTKVCSFRFYEWTIPSGDIVAGWRVVETHNAPINFVAPMNPDGITNLGDFIIGSGTGIVTIPYMPANSTVNQILGFVNNRATMPTYDMNINQNGGFHINSGTLGNNSSFRNSDWFRRNNFEFYQSNTDAQKHVFFNVHPKSLRKRDVDKFGIERFLAQEIETDLTSGKLTFFPFMDDEHLNNPGLTSNFALDRTNCKFSPIVPIVNWTIGNAEVDCGVGSGVALGLPNTNGDILAVFGITSPIISERLELDTRILVEKFAHEGNTDNLNTVAIIGSGSGANSISCVADLLRTSAYTVHTNSDGFICFNIFDYGQAYDGMRTLEYRPDLPLTASTVTDPSKFENLLGYSGILGDAPGFSPGVVLGSSAFSDISSFQYKTNSRENVKNRFPKVQDSQIEEITVSKSKDKITIPVSLAYNGITEIFYSLNNKIDVIILFKIGSQISGSIDSISLNQTTGSTERFNHSWFKADTIEINGNGIENIEIKDILITQLKNEVSDDFLKDPSKSSSSDKNAIYKNNLYKKNILFKSDVISIGQDLQGKIYIFFNDQDKGISCVQSDDQLKKWFYYYGVIESITGIKVQHPFVIDSRQQNKCTLLYLFNGNIMSKQIDYNLFRFEDAFLIERFEQDILVLNTNGLNQEKLSIFSRDGKILRRSKISYPAAGDMKDPIFLNLIGLDINTGKYVPEEQRLVNKVNTSGQQIVVQESVRKNPIAIGNSTAFTNSSIKDIFFSGYRRQSGEHRIFFLGTTVNGIELQCHFSLDDGIVWYDLWEFVQFKYSRLKMDKNKNTQFIDQGSSGGSLFSVDPLNREETYPFGINIHWSRLKRHKVSGSNPLTIDSNSQTLKITCPYVIHHEFSGESFLFYVYNKCLLCKIFHDGMIDNTAKEEIIKENDNTLEKMDYVKFIIERKTRSYFIDGNLDNDDIKEEIHYFINTTTNEQQIEGNIILNSQFGIGSFNASRNIPDQRVCAYRFSNCNIRVFYKLENSPKLHAATWTGSEWIVEEFMKNTQNQLPVRLPDDNNVKKVTGGFGSNIF